ncbi:hypothetical protein Clacol_010587 [Clathrus columnatus]|uniref:Uncharacterized protein n=1 Tax=Clathrus columnatus TaxID=1419009 RepID=A0AAV5ANR5_9AGAM|nr:hypothetical protein Clacol_010587 [Clathrus columnatus]
MDQWIKTVVTARVLRTIDKMGGLDNYLLGTRTDLLGYEGMRLRVMIRDKKRQLAKIPTETESLTVSS